MSSIRKWEYNDFMKRRSMNTNEKRTPPPQQYLHQCPPQQSISSETLYHLFQSPYTYP